MGTSLSPRVKLATRLYATGAVPTKAAAALAAGLDPGYFYIISSEKNGKEEVHELITGVDETIQQKSIDMSAVIRALGRKAVQKIERLMDSENEHVSLKAAIDLADRSPETQKIQKHQVESFTLDGKDAKELALALVEAAKVGNDYAELAEGDFVRVPMEVTSGRQRDEQQEARLPASTKGEAAPERGSEPSQPSNGEQGLVRSHEGVDSPQRQVAAKSARLARLAEVRAKRSA